MAAIASSYRRAALFLNGYYDRRHPGFYARSCRPDTLVICADGALSTFSWLRDTVEDPPSPDVIVGDFDSLTDGDRRLWEAAGVLFEAKRDQDHTDGQIALHRALGVGCRKMCIHGATPTPGDQDHDHFLGNITLLTEAARGVSGGPGASAFISEPSEAIYVCSGRLHLPRCGPGLNRVSLLAHHGDARIARSDGLRWDLSDFDVRTTHASALRNEIPADSSHCVIEVAVGSPPIVVVHNWYESEETLT